MKRMLTCVNTTHRMMLSGIPIVRFVTPILVSDIVEGCDSRLSNFTISQMTLRLSGGRLLFFERMATASSAEVHFIHVVVSTVKSHINQFN